MTLPLKGPLKNEFSAICSSLYCTEEYRTGQSSLGVSSPALSKRAGSPSSWLAILLLMQPRTLFSFATKAHCCLMFSLVYPRTHRSYSSKLLSSWAVPSIYIFFLPMCRIWYFPLLNFIRFLSAHFSRLLTSLWWQHDPLISAAPPSFKFSEKNSWLCALPHHPDHWWRLLKDPVLTPGVHC